MNGSLLILKATKWFWIFSEELSSQSPLFYIIGSVVISLVTITVIDVMTALAEVSERESEERPESERTPTNMRQEMFSAWVHEPSTWLSVTFSLSPWNVCLHLAN